MNKPNSDSGMNIEGWKTINWHQAEKYVFKLQKRIYAASRRGDVKRVRKLQKTLMRSWSNKVLAVRRVTVENQGKKTAGVDGLKSLPPEARLELVRQLKLTGKSKPTRRVWIPKPGRDEKRPLGIPTMYDRALQAVVKSALEPEWEAVFETNSYGFRPGRSCHDAIKQIKKLYSQQSKIRTRCGYSTLCAPRLLTRYPQPSWERLRRKSLGQPTHLESKDEGDNSMLVKPEMERRR